MEHTMVEQGLNADGVGVLPPMKLFEDPGLREDMPLGKPPIAVIGAGFSGTMAALHLLRRVPADQPVLLCERAAEFARGVAYATGDNDHLLNVRATNMSALADDPSHFADWLRQCVTPRAGGVHETAAGQFASRGMYGHYLRGILDSAMRETAHRGQLRLLPDDITDVIARAGGGYDLVCASGNRLEVAGVVVAVGNLPPEENIDPRLCGNPWGDKAWRPLSSDAPVLIIGTGLTMVDLVLSIRRRGFTGQVIALSRGGLIPSRHLPAGAWETPVLTPEEERSLPKLMRRVRDEVRRAAAQGVDWRAVVDSLRPITARIWQRLPVAERRRFLRHARRYWDVARHRMAPPNADMIDAMIADGSLRITAGRIQDFDTTSPEAVAVTFRHRRTGVPETLRVQRVIMASGLEQIARTRDPLMQRLLDRGLLRMDSQGMGLDVTDNLNAISRDGSVAHHIWALGPIVRGVFWECIAVPDIRVQASQLAQSVAARLKEEAPRWSFNI
jgi:uncharacterized NAD(P)/FAD-binding protein YdhS